MRIAVAYVRVSREDENPENQIYAIKSFAKERGFEVAEFFVDEAVSGARKAIERPRFSELLKFSRRFGIKTIIMYDIARLGRTYEDIKETYDRLKSEGYELLFVKHPYLDLGYLFDAIQSSLKVESDNPVAQAMLKMVRDFLKYIRELLEKAMFDAMAAQAEAYRMEVSMRTKEALRRLKEKGVKLGAKPKVDDVELLKCWKKGVRDIRELSEKFGVHKSTIYRHLKKLGLI